MKIVAYTIFLSLRLLTTGDAAGTVVVWAGLFVVLVIFIIVGASCLSYLS